MYPVYVGSEVRDVLAHGIRACPGQPQFYYKNINICVC